MKMIGTEPRLYEEHLNPTLMNRILKIPSLLVGGAMFAVLIILAVSIPFISPYDPSEQNLSAFCNLRLPNIGSVQTNWDVICLPD